MIKTVYPEIYRAYIAELIRHLNEDDTDSIPVRVELGRKLNMIHSSIYNIEEMDSFIEHQNYVCKKCKTPIARKLDFIRHIKNQHNFEETMVL